MEIHLHYTFHATVTRRRSRRSERHRFRQTRPLAVTIPEAQPDELQHALDVVSVGAHAHQGDVRRLYLWRESFWEPLYSNVQDRYPFSAEALPPLLHDADATPGDDFDKREYRSVEDNDEEDVRAGLVARARGYLIVGGSVFERVREPRYHVRAGTFQGAVRVTLDVVDDYDPSEPRAHYFRADREADARAYARQLALRLGGTDAQYERIVVHDPASLRCDPDSDGVRARIVRIAFTARGALDCALRLPEDATPGLVLQQAALALRAADRSALMAAIDESPESRIVDRVDGDA